MAGSNAKERPSGRTDTRKLALLGMFCAISFVVVYLAKLVPFFAFIPSVPFLKYDPKDIIIAIGGFMMGPLEALVISAVVSVVEMFTISSTGMIGCVMNILSTAAFACPAAFIYRKKHTMRGAVVGLACGLVLMTAVMLLWNYLITPLYMTVTREFIVTLLLPAFLPFNLIKAGVNMALTMLLYKPVVTALRKARLMPPSSSGAKRRMSPGFIVLALVLLSTCILVALVFMGVI